MAANQASPEEVDLRVNYVYMLLLRHMPTAKVVRHCLAKKNWGVTGRQIRNYIIQAEQLMANEAKAINRRAELKKAIETYRLLLERLLAKGDDKGAATMQDRIVALLKVNVADHLYIDWREEAEASGVNPSELFNRLLTELATNERTD